MREAAALHHPSGGRPSVPAPPHRQTQVADLPHLCSFCQLLRDLWVALTASPLQQEQGKERDLSAGLIFFSLEVICHLVFMGITLENKF